MEGNFFFRFLLFCFDDARVRYNLIRLNQKSSSSFSLCLFLAIECQGLMLIHFLRFVFVLFFCFFSPVWKIPGPVGGGGDDAAAATAASFFFFPTVCLRRSESKAATNPAPSPPPHPPTNRKKKKRCMEHLCCCSRDSLTVIHAYHSGRLGVAFPHSFRPFLLLLLSGGGGISSDSLSLSFSLDSSKEHVELFERGGPSHSNVAKRCCCYVPRRCRHVEIFVFFPPFLFPPWSFCTSSLIRSPQNDSTRRTKHLFFYFWRRRRTTCFFSSSLRDEDLSWWVATFPSCQRGPPFQLTSRPKRYHREEEEEEKKESERDGGREERRGRIRRSRRIIIVVDNRAAAWIPRFFFSSSLHLEEKKEGALNNNNNNNRTTKKKKRKKGEMKNIWVKEEEEEEEVL